MEVPSVDDINAFQRKELEQQENDERKKLIIDQILEPAAKDRLTRLGLVKPDKCRSVEDSLIRAATTGQLKGKVTDQQLIHMLEQISADGASSGSSGPKIIVRRRNYGIDDEDDLDDDDI